MNALCLVFLIMAGQGDLDWYAHYEKGVRSVETGDAAVAISELELALESKPEAELSVPTYPYEYVDYTPHLFLSIAHRMRGELVSARKELELAEASGIAERSEYGRHLLEAQRILLTGRASQPLPPRPMLSEYWTRPEVLSEAEFESLKDDVLKHCPAGYEPADADTTWYAHYERALELARDGNRPQALAELLEAIVRRPEPQRRARTYGMWLVDYYPYFHLARLHAQMQNWECARDAIAVSKRLDEIAPSSKEFTEFMMLDYESRQRASQH